MNKLILKADGKKIDLAKYGLAGLDNNLDVGTLEDVVENINEAREIASSMSVKTIIDLFKALSNNDREKVLQMEPEDKIKFAKSCAEICKLLSLNPDVAVQVNNQIPQMSEEEAKRFEC